MAYHYPIIYWNCACLSVDSSAINESDFYNLMDDEIIDVDNGDKKVQNKMDYAKLASALDKFKNICHIDLPNINDSRLSFTPDVKHNRILYGLKGISRITDPVIQEIMANRPYNSLQDFLNKITKRVITKDKVINLIKSGAFNDLEQKDIKTILNDFIWLVCDPKKKLTMQNANMLIDMNLLPHEFEYQMDVYKLTKELRKNRDENRLWYCGDRLEIPGNKIDAWRQIFKDSNIEVKDIVIDGEPRRVLSSDKWDYFYESQMNKIKKHIKDNHDVLLNKLNNRLFQQEFEKYCQGDEVQWQLDSLNFYFDKHPLTPVIEELRARDIWVDRVDTIEEGAQDGIFFIKGKIIPKMKLYTIAGTVIDRDKTKGLVTLQCPSGVVTLKVYKDLYATMAQVIGDIDEMGNKDIEQDSFFEKGVHLLVTGIQRGATFIPKVYKNTGRKAILRIVLDDEGYLADLEEKM